jgi:hypothetical protein
MNSKCVLQMSLFLNSHLITYEVGVMSNGNLCNNHCLKYICMIKMWGSESCGSWYTVVCDDLKS